MYDDIFVRDALSDTGQIPSGVRTAYYSPDIIPWGNAAKTDSETFFASNYNQDVGKNLVSQEMNYLYARGKNLYPGTESGNIFLYYVPSSLLAQPSLWRNNQIPTGTPGQNYAKFDSVPQNEIVVGDRAFQWLVPSPPTGYHYCLIGQVVTEAHPNPLPATDFASTEAFVDWIVTNPGICWRNVSILYNSSPPDWQSKLNFANLDHQEQLYAFTVKSEHMPVGTAISLVCSASGPNPPINVSGTVPSGQDPWYLYTENLIPASFSSNVIITAHLPQGQSWPAGATITPTYNRIVSAKDGENLRRYALEPEKLGLPAHIAARASNLMVRLGTYTVQVQ